MHVDAESAYNQLTTNVAAAVRTPLSTIFEATAQLGETRRPYPQYLSRIAFFETMTVDLGINEPSRHFQLAVQVDVNGLDYHRAGTLLEEQEELTIVERKPADSIRLHLIDWHRHRFTTWHLAVDPVDDGLHIQTESDAFGMSKSREPTPLDAMLGINRRAAPPEASLHIGKMTTSEELAVINGLLGGTAKSDRATQFAAILDSDDYPDHRRINSDSMVGRLAQANFLVLGEHALRDAVLHKWVRAAYEDAAAA